MSLKHTLYLSATAISLVSCGGGSNTSSPADPNTQIDGTAALVSVLTNGISLQDSTKHWLCETTNSALTTDGINSNEFRFFSDLTGLNGDVDIGADQAMRWAASNANTVEVTFTDTDPETLLTLNSITLNEGNTQFTTSVEEFVGVGLPRADYSCTLTNNSEQGGGPVTPPDGGNEPGGELTLAQRLITDGTAETGISWGCTYSNSSNSFVYGFNADGTGVDFNSDDSITTGIDYVISEPNSIRATFVNTTFASLLWNQITFQDDDNFTAIDGLTFDETVTVSCTKGAPAAPPAPPAPIPVAATCPCQINSVTQFLNDNSTNNTFVTASSFAGGRSADIDLDGDSIIDMGVIVRDTGIRDCSFSPFSAEFGIEDPGLVSLSSTEATACIADLDVLLNQ